MMHGRGKSDFAIVAVKLANKAERSAAELVEPRAETKGNAGWQSTRRTQSRISVSKALARIRQALAVWTRGRSRMRESLMYGSVRGTRGNSRPYRDEAFRRGLSETGQRSCGPAFSGISLAAPNALLSFPSMRQIQPPRPRSRRSRSRALARWSRPRRQRARQKLCGSYRPKL